MKKLMLSAAILFSLAMQATAQTSNFVIFDQDGESFYAILNGVRQNNTPQTNVRITGLMAPAGYKVTLIFRDSTIPRVEKSFYLQNPSTEITTNVVTKKSGEHVLRWVSETPLAQAPPPPAGQNNVVYTTTEQPMGGTTTVVTQQTTTAPNGGSVSMNMNGMGTGMNVSVNGAVSQTTVTTTTTSSSTGGDMGQAPPPPIQQQYVDGYSGPVGCPMPMSHEDYEGAKRTIAAKDFETDKLTIAEQIASSNCLTEGQVKGILMLFTFENNKLDFAKFAYNHTYDKGNYYKINDAFTFSSSTDALNQYINSQH
ncbi:MAG TPA: DUF4476 domain-containing protein [Bacteroidia bacterium]|nr:DUF4476 domain-containing protein [Bacteroidia bacterium]